MSLLYEVGLRAIQFGNNWMKNIPRTAKTGLGLRPPPIWRSEKFFGFNHFQIGQACSPLTYQLYSQLVNPDFLACHRREILYIRTRPFVVETKTPTIENKHFIHYFKRFPQTLSACFVMLTSKRNYISVFYFLSKVSVLEYIFKNR